MSELWKKQIAVNLNDTQYGLHIFGNLFWSGGIPSVSLRLHVEGSMVRPEVRLPISG